MSTRLLPLKSTKPKLEKLTNKQLRFVQEYLASPEMNATDAARKAGYANPKQASYALLKNVEVQRALSKAQYDRNKRSEITNDQVLAELEKLAFRSFRDFLNAEGMFDVRRLGDLPDAVLDCIDGLECEDIRNAEGELVGQRVKLKLVGKLKAIELVMKHRGMLTEKVEHEHTIKKIDWKGMAQPMEKPNNVIDSTFVKQAALTVDDDKSNLDTDDVVQVADYREELTELGEPQDDS